MRTFPIPELITANMDAWSRGSWWHRQAAKSFRCGWTRMILGRTDNDLYLLRCWLVKPQIKADNGTFEGQFSSENAVLLHWFPRGDDDGSMHDHPWPFTTTILEGGYYEHTPAFDWKPGTGLGPELGDKHLHYAGATVHHEADDLHYVGDLVTPGHVGGLGGGTWTLVRTGAECRTWGFHPPGKPWVPWRQFIAERRASKQGAQ